MTPSETSATITDAMVERDEECAQLCAECGARYEATTEDQT